MKLDIEVTVDPDCILEQMTAGDIVDWVIDTYSVDDVLERVDEIDAIKYFNIEVAK